MGVMESQYLNLWSEIEKAADHLVRLITTTRVQLAQVEHEMIDHLAVVSQDGHRSLGTAQRIVAALEKRVHLINSFLQHGTEADLRAAIKVAASALVLPNDCMSKLISEADHAPIEPAGIKPTLDKLLSRIVLSKQRVAF